MYHPLWHRPKGLFSSRFRSTAIDRVNSRRQELSGVSDVNLRAVASKAHTLPEILAITAIAAERTFGFRLFDVQLHCALALADGKIAEMQTGEGKTLSAVPVIAWLARAGKGVHVMTVNDYLARRDAEWMKPIYDIFDISIGCIQQELPREKRREAYECDITYATANEIGFDFLRDQTDFYPDHQVHRPFAAAVIDEVDSILIDEARIPLVLAGGEPTEGALACQVDQLTRNFECPLHYTRDEYGKNVVITEAGIQAVEDAFGCPNLFSEQNVPLYSAVRDSVHAYALLHRDIDYVVRNNSIESIDEFKGRIVKGRRWPAGLHAALEAKEAITPKIEGKVLASITLQNLIGLYPRVCGMTGTAATQREEFQSIYELDVEVIPPNRPNIRVDLPDKIFSTKREKERAVIAEVRRSYECKQPVLIGTASVQESERLSALLGDVPHFVLNARNEEEEARVIKRAGECGAVTISTNMAGRGTDIKLGEGASQLGGLRIIGTNKHESRRIDNQLRGRAGRQGDPGSSQFFISLEDDLLVKFGIANTELNHTPESIQQLIEGQNLETRLYLNKYEYLIEAQRQAIQHKRQAILTGVAPSSSDLERLVSLRTLDELWSEHLASAAELRESSYVVAWGGKDPLRHYLQTIQDMFETLQDVLETEIPKRLREAQEAGMNPAERGATWTYLTTDQPFGTMQERFMRGVVDLFKKHSRRGTVDLAPSTRNPEQTRTPPTSMRMNSCRNQLGSYLLALLGVALGVSTCSSILRSRIPPWFGSFPVLVSFVGWMVFIIFWRRGTKDTYTAKNSEPIASRRIHQTFLNIAFAMLFIPIPGLTQQFLPTRSILFTTALAIQAALSVFAIWARCHLGLYWRRDVAISQEHQLIRSGPYRFVRHPMYVAIIGMFICAAIVSGELHALFGVLIVAGAYFRKIRIEESFLQRAFGEEYADYRGKTSGIVPFGATWFS